MAISWTLTFLTGPNKGKTITLSTARTVVGRTRGDIVLSEDKRASSTHAEFVVDQGVLAINDLKSRNGVELNGARVDSAKLKSGDTVVLGDTEIRIASLSARSPAIATAPTPSPGPAAQAPTAAPKKNLSSSARALGFSGPATAHPTPQGEDEISVPAPPPPVTLAQVKDLVRGEAPTAESFAADAIKEKFATILFRPLAFFDELGSGDDGVADALAFALICAVLETGIGALAMSSGWCADTIGFGKDSTIVGQAVGTLWFLATSLALIPMSSVIARTIAIASGGAGGAKPAIKIACYSRAAMPLGAIAACVPGVGPMLKLACIAYSCALVGIGVLRAQNGKARLVAAVTAGALLAVVGGTILSGDLLSTNARGPASAPAQSSQPKNAR